MEVFTYTRRGLALRTTIYMFCTALVADLVTVGVVALLVPSYWKAVTLVVGGGGMALGYWALTRPLRTAHRLDGAMLTLQFGRFRLGFDRRSIVGVRPFREALPRGLSAPTLQVVYRPETDALYILAEKKGLVEVSLAEPCEARLPKAGLIQFSRVVLSLDEPDRFVAALGGASVEVAVVVRAEPLAAGIGAAPAGAGAAIRLDGLVKRYDDFEAVRGVSLAVAPGEVLAFLGSNGAGKTTTIKMMTGLLRPTAGKVEICGQDLWAGGAEVRRQVGYVPDVPLLYEGLTAREFLWLMAGLYGLDRAEGRRRTEELLGLMKLERWSDHLIRSFSLGMKRKMAIAAALVHRPRVLLLDEVTNGLDPRAAREVKDLILQAASQGTAIFLTTHLLDVVQELAHRIAIIDRGELKALGTAEELRAQAGAPGASLEELFLLLTAPKEVVA